jgi:8-oxo-dGTP pyrophosphatase MutT (NUDIX family)
MRKPCWRALARRRVYRNPWITVFEDRVKRPDGTSGTYGVVEVGDAVSVVAMERGRICLVRQYRHSWGKRVWEVPCGGLHKGESPLKAARRELREEAGITARRWRGLGCVEANDPIVNRFRLFLATGLAFGRHQRDESEADMEHRMWGLEDLKKAVMSGRIRDDMTIACVAKCLMVLGRRL